MAMLLLPTLVLAQGWKSAGGNLDTAVKGVGLEDKIETTTGSVVKVFWPWWATVFWLNRLRRHPVDDRLG